jgi:photosystem II stability/assembly factor-like uncharacterized protein
MVAVPVKSKAVPMPAISLDNVQPGLSYRYFEGSWNQLPDFNSIKAKQKGISKGLDTDYRGNRDINFAFSYKGLIRVPSSGFYTLVMKSCDGSRIFIDKKLILDNDGMHSATERRVTVVLEEGLHRFECNWFRGDNPGHKEFTGIWLGWECPNSKLEMIPATAFFSEQAKAIPSITLKIKDPTEKGDNMLVILPQIEARGTSLDRVVIFQGNMIWGQSTKVPYAISGPLSPGINRLRGRLYYDGCATVDGSEIIEVEGAGVDLSPWKMAVQGESGLPHAFNMKGDTIDFIGDGEYFVYQKIRGDFTLTCRVDSFLSQAAGADPASWIGLLVKETDKLNQGGHFGIYHTAGYGLRGSCDTSDIVGTRMSTMDYSKDHPWIHVVRRGNVFTGYSSSDNKNWKKTTEWTWPMSEELYAGLTFRTIPHRSPSLFRGTISNTSLTVGSPQIDEVIPVKNLDKNAPCISGLVQSISQPELLLARTTHDGLLISRDEGNSWHKANKGRKDLAGLAVRSVAINHKNPSIMLCATGMVASDGKLESGLWRSVNSGLTWQLVTNGIDFDGQGPTRFCGEVVAFDPQNPQIAVAAGETSGIFISRDAGQTWQRTGLEGERITCVKFHPSNKPGYLLVATCADEELSLFGLGQPASSAPKASEGCLYQTRDHGVHWHRRFNRKSFGVTNIALRDTYIDLIVLSSTRGIYTSECMAYKFYQRNEGIDRDTPFTALGTDERYQGVVFYAAPLASKKASPIVTTGNWQRWKALSGIPAGENIVAITVGVDDKTVFIVRTSSILRFHPNTGVETIYTLRK